MIVRGIAMILEIEMPFADSDDEPIDQAGEIAKDGDETAPDHDRRGRGAEDIPLPDRLAAPDKANPMPPTSGPASDKALFDALSGDL